MFNLLFQTVPINVTLQRKKSLPDFQALPGATEAMSREEVSALGSARREAVRRQIEMNEKLKANPLLYLVSPQVKVNTYIQRKGFIYLYFHKLHLYLYLYFVWCLYRSGFPVNSWYCWYSSLMLFWPWYFLRCLRSIPGSVWLQPHSSISITLHGDELWLAHNCYCIRTLCSQTNVRAWHHYLYFLRSSSVQEKTA